jgi:hypothetical protein
MVRGLVFCCFLSSVLSGFSQADSTSDSSPYKVGFAFGFNYSIIQASISESFLQNVSGSVTAKGINTGGATGHLVFTRSMSNGLEHRIMAGGLVNFSEVEFQFAGSHAERYDVQPLAVILGTKLSYFKPHIKKNRFGFTVGADFLVKVPPNEKLIFAVSPFDLQICAGLSLASLRRLSHVNADLLYSRGLLNLSDTHASIENEILSQVNRHFVTLILYVR